MFTGNSNDSYSNNLILTIDLYIRQVKLSTDRLIQKIIEKPTLHFYMPEKLILVRALPFNLREEICKQNTTYSTSKQFIILGVSLTTPLLWNTCILKPFENELAIRHVSYYEILDMNSINHSVKILLAE